MTAPGAKDTDTGRSAASGQADGGQAEGGQAERHQPATEPAFAEPVIETRRRLSIVWFVPLVAVAIAAWLVYTTLAEQGPTVSITFNTATGLEAGKTKVKYKDVEVGLVEAVRLSDDLARIIVTARLDKTLGPHLAEGTRFWVVRPRLGAGGVSGLDTLVSGAFIEIDPGTGAPARSFTGLEIPPVRRSDEPGLEFVLETGRLGSLDAGSPIYFQGIEVGEVLGYALRDEGKRVDIESFVRAPYHRLVRANSRFWNTSGLDLSVDANGFTLSMESLQTLLTGGIAFDTPTGDTPAAPAQPGTHFTLYDTYDSIREGSFVRRLPIVMYFEGSVRGLTVGAPVEFRGIKVGRVTDIRIEFDRETLDIRIPVTAEIEPERATAAEAEFDDPYGLMQALVARGLRGQLLLGSVVTGQLLVSLDFHDEAPPATLTFGGPHPVLPTVPSKVEELTASVSSILARLGNLPLEELIQDLRSTVQSAEGLVGAPELLGALVSLDRSLRTLDQLVGRVDGQMGPILDNLVALSGEAQTALQQAQSTLRSADRMVGQNSQISYGVQQLLGELTNAARSFRILADYLEAHPEALIRGKTGGYR